MKVEIEMGFCNETLCPENRWKAIIVWKFHAYNSEPLSNRSSMKMWSVTIIRFPETHDPPLPKCWLGYALHN